MHCGKIQSSKACKCHCEICGLARVRIYTRYATGDKKCENWCFERETDGTLVVAETASSMLAQPVTRATGVLILGGSGSPIQETCAFPLNPGEA